MTKSETAELRRLDRKIMSGKANRAEVLRAIDLKNKKHRENVTQP